MRSYASFINMLTSLYDKNRHNCNCIYLTKCSKTTVRIYEKYNPCTGKVIFINEKVFFSIIKKEIIIYHFHSCSLLILMNAFVPAFSTLAD